MAQPYVTRSYLAPERDSADQGTAAALTILAEILGGGTTSYLTEKLQFDQKIAVWTGAYYNGTSLDDTTFDIIVVPAEDIALQDAEDAMDAAVADFMSNGVDQEQLDRIKMQLRASQIYARDNVDGIANRYGRALAIGLNVQDVQAWPDILQAITADDIMAAARDLFREETSVTGWLMRDRKVTQ